MAIYQLRKFVAPEFIFGVGARHRVGHYARNMLARKVLIVSDPGVIAAGWADQVKADLTEMDIDYVVFSNLTPNPKDHEIMAGVEVYTKEHCDVIVGVGGGTVMDAAKAIGISYTNRCDIHRFEGVDNVDVPGPPLICIPTTAGTSADISQFCIIVNSEERYKMAIISKTVVPDVALVDPETTTTMERYFIACAGIDALTHAIEAFVSTASSPVVDVHALNAIKLLWENIEAAVFTPENLACRENMMLGSLQAGLAFSNASLGAVHALAHSLGGYLDLPHGECNALLLEHVIRFNISNVPDRYRQIAEMMKIDTRGMSERACGQRITQELAMLRHRVGINDSLQQRGVHTTDIPELAAHASHDACLVTNPRYVRLDDIKAIYGEAM